MGAATVDNFPLLLGLIGVVITISALLSGFIERSNFPQVLVFLGLGAAVGPYRLGLLDVGLDSPMLRTVATLSLALVLFTDALGLDLEEVKKHAGLAALILGPGTIIAAGAIGLAAVYVLNLPPVLAAVLAAPLASTDPVILRALLRRPDLPSAARQALRLESGLNDVVLLPIILVAMTFLMPQGPGNGDGIGQLALKMLVIGPGAGAVIAWLGIKGLDAIRSKVGVRRDYESIYSLGIAFAAFAAAEAMHGSGYLAAFSAGLTIAAIDVELCDCFREYGETTAEMLLLFTFVLLGTSVIWQGIGAATPAIALFAFLALLARPLGLFFALAGTRTDAESKRTIIWFGPRGLSTLLLILVPVFAGVPGSESMLHIATVVVLASITIHGGSIMLFARNGDKHHALQEPHSAVAPSRMSPAELRKLMDDGEEVWLVDVRSERSYLDSDLEIEDAVRINPQHARREMIPQGIPKDAWVALFCT